MAYEDYGYVNSEYNPFLSYRIPNQETVDSEIDYLKKVSKYTGEDSEKLINSYNLVNSELNEMMARFMSKKQISDVNDYFETEDPNPEINKTKKLIDTVFNRQMVNFNNIETRNDKPGSLFGILYKLLIAFSAILIVLSIASIIFFNPLMNTNIGLSIDVSSNTMFVISLSFLILSSVLMVGSFIIEKRISQRIHEEYFYYLIRSLIKGDPKAEEFETMHTHSIKLKTCKIVLGASYFLYFLFFLIRVFLMMNFESKVMKLMHFDSTQPMQVYFANFLLLIGIFFVFNLLIVLIHMKLAKYNRKERMEYFK